MLNGRSHVPSVTVLTGRHRVLGSCPPPGTPSSCPTLCCPPSVSLETTSCRGLAGTPRCRKRPSCSEVRSACRLRKAAKLSRESTRRRGREGEGGREDAGNLNCWSNLSYRAQRCSSRCRPVSSRTGSQCRHAPSLYAPRPQENRTTVSVTQAAICRPSQLTQAGCATDSPTSSTNIASTANRNERICISPSLSLSQTGADGGQAGVAVLLVHAVYVAARHGIPVYSPRAREQAARALDMYCRRIDLP